MYEVFTFGGASVHSVGVVGVKLYWLAMLVSLGLGSGLIAVIAMLRTGPKPFRIPRIVPSPAFTMPEPRPVWSGTRAWEKRITNEALLPGKIIWEPRVFRMRVSLMYHLWTNDIAERRAQSA